MLYYYIHNQHQVYNQIPFCFKLKFVMLQFKVGWFMVYNAFSETSIQLNTPRQHMVQTGIGFLNNTFIGISATQLASDPSGGEGT